MTGILIGLGVLLLAGIVFAMAFNPGVERRKRFIDDDDDGEPDVSPDEKRRGLED
jgi:hypothetical protein